MSPWHFKYCFLILKKWRVSSSQFFYVFTCCFHFVLSIYFQIQVFAASRHFFYCKEIVLNINPYRRISWLLFPMCPYVVRHCFPSGRHFSRFQFRYTFLSFLRQWLRYWVWGHVTKLHNMRNNGEKTKTFFLCIICIHFNAINSMIENNDIERT